MKGYDVLTIFAYMVLYVHLFPHVSKIFVCLDLITSHHEKHPVLCRIDSQLIIKMLFIDIISCNFSDGQVSDPCLPPNGGLTGVYIPPHLPPHGMRELQNGGAL